MYVRKILQPGNGKTISGSSWTSALYCAALLISACWQLPMCGTWQDHCVTCGDGSILYIFISHINVLFLLQTLILNTSG